jgi:hypothetical protein
MIRFAKLKCKEVFYLASTGVAILVLLIATGSFGEGAGSGCNEKSIESAATRTAGEPIDTSRCIASGSQFTMPTADLA